MVQTVENAIAIPLSKRCDYYRCNKCRDMFRPMMHYVFCEYVDTIPYYCPNCGAKFANGGTKLV